MIIDELKPYSFRYRVIIVLFVIDLFAWLLAGFSMYYIKYSREAMDIICLFSLITAGSGMTSVKNVKVSLQYLLACLAVIFIPILIYGDTPFVAVISKLCFAIAFISLKPNFKMAIYKLFLKSFTVIVFLGIVEFVLLFFNISFTWAVVERAEPYQVLNQGLFILIPTYSIEGFARFMSLCEEPGGLGTICFFLLTTLNYKEHKITYLILLMAGFISFSLGFYVLITLWTLVNSRRLGFSQIILGALAIAFLMTYFSGFVEERIVERVAGRSFSEVDNRTDDETTKKLVEISGDGRIYYGMGNRNYYRWQTSAGGTSAGVKNFIFQYGVIGLIIIVLGFSFVVFRIRGFHKAPILIVLFFWICFYKSNLWNLPQILVALMGYVPVLNQQMDKKRDCLYTTQPLKHENSIS